MLTKNLTSFLFGAKTTSRKPPQREMTCVVRAAFRMEPGKPLLDLPHPEQGMLSADTLGADDDDLLGECIAPSDFADTKLVGEVLFKGSCHTPGGRPLTECPVKLAVGDWSKSLRVLGPRQWNVVSGAASDPGTFTTATLNWANAFGGPGFAKNPVGKGADGLEVPCVEYPDDPVRKSSSHEPATFAPISPYWPARAALVGKEYGAGWRKKRSPFYAEDFDWRYFQSAPQDQRLPTFLRGDEEVTLQNLHPKAPIVSFQLPAIRVRVFAKGKDATFREVPMLLDTLFVDADESKVFLTWRGLDAVAEEDLSDVATMLIASEPLSSKPGSVDGYREQLEAYERDPVGLEGKLPEAAMFQGVPNADDVDPVSRLLAEKGVPEDVRVDVRKALAEAAKADAMRGEPQLDLEKAIAPAKAEHAPAYVPIKPGVMPPQRLRSKMRGMLEAVAEARADLAKKKAEIDALPRNENEPKETAALREKLAIDASGLDQAEQLARDPRLSEIDPSYSYPEPLSTDQPGPNANLAEHDLRGHDLRGADLRGANLQAADLSQADLRGAQLQGANLKWAVLWAAKAEGADFTGADVTLVNAIGLQGKGANFSKAKLDLTSFEGAMLDEAIFEGAAATYVNFSKASLRRAKLSGAELSSSELDEAKLQAASLSGAVAEKCLFAKADLTGADLSRARLTGSSFVESTCDDANFQNAGLVRTLFTKVSAKDARFAGAHLHSTMFEHARAPGASFTRVRARQARFYKSVLDACDFSQADLMSADFRRARLVRASFRDASLYDAKLLDAAGDHVDFRGANLVRALVTES